MKKLLFFFALLTMFFLSGCNNGAAKFEPTKDAVDSTDDSSRKQGELYGECYPNETCNKGFVCDIENNICIKENYSSDNDKNDTVSESDDNQTDTVSEHDDTDPADSAADTDPADLSDSSNDSSSLDHENDDDVSDSADDSCDSQPDNDSDTSDSGNDSDTSDSDNDSDTSDSDNDSDTSDSGNDTDLPDADNGDSTPESSSNVNDLPECTAGSYPCKDPESQLVWSSLSATDMNWLDAVKYCRNISEGNAINGYSDWHLPTISELRTLIQNCESTVLGGSCEVSDTCYYQIKYSSTFYPTICQKNCSSCPYDLTGKYSKLEDICSLWSSSIFMKAECSNSCLITDQDNAWEIKFSNGEIITKNRTIDEIPVRCVKSPVKTIDCTELIENAHWNTVSKITQTWNGSEWLPTEKGSYNEEFQSNKCVYACNEGYHWNSAESTCDDDNTRKAYCTGLPQYAEWNTVSSIIQHTTNGTEWTPSTQGVYSQEESTTECHYKCKEHYLPYVTDEGTICRAETRTVPCDTKPANTVWCHNGTVTQIWSYYSEGWEPSTNVQVSADFHYEDYCQNQCAVKCAPGYYSYYNNETDSYYCAEKLNCPQGSFGSVSGGGADTYVCCQYDVFGNLYYNWGYSENDSCYKVE